MSLSGLEIKRKYRTFTEEIIKDFYNPILSNSIIYKRSVGYFSSKILLGYIKGLKDFIKNDGYIQLIISPFVTSEDAVAFYELNSYNEDIIEEKINSLFNSYSDLGKMEVTSAQILAYLMKNRKLEIKVAIPKSKLGVFHEKISIFSDKTSNIVATIGSNNETANAVYNNIESFNVFCSWVPGQDLFALDHKRDFEQYWDNQHPDIKVLTLSDAVSENILRKYESDMTIEQLYEYLTISETEEKIYNLDYKPRDFQLKAVNDWLISKTGIISFATGTGKTKTAIYAMKRLYQENTHNIFLIVVPDITLINQWYFELIEYRLNPIKCYSGETSWIANLRDFIDEVEYADTKHGILIVTKDTFQSENFQSQLKRLKNNFVFIADECHRLGTDRLLRLLPNTEYRMGLSATPEIYFSAERTEKLFSYFGGIIAKYDLKDAIDNNDLVPYNYYPIFVKLNEEEMEKYREESKRISRMIGHDDESKIANAEEILEQLLFKRARILYNAREKLNQLDLLGKELLNDKYLIVYCGVSTSDNLVNISENEELSLTQLEAVNLMLTELGLSPVQYTSKESEGEREIALNAFKSGTISPLVAIRCLDEGINIPQIRKAIILASSGNPREFIQRRGRLLRNFGDKKIAHIYDLVVFSDEDDYRSINKIEMKRVKEFLSIASNKNDYYKDLNPLFSKYLKEGEVS